MSKRKNLSVCLGTLILSGLAPLHAQEAENKREEAVDLKMNLVETKLELLDSRIRLWEDKPALLEMKFSDIENRMAKLSFSPEQFNEKFRQLDSLIREEQSRMKEQREFMASLPEIAESSESAESGTGEGSCGEPVLPPPARYVISIYPVHLFEGNLLLSVERVLNKGNSIELSAMATYATKGGLANYYLKNQRLEYYDAAIADYVPYESENISGYGGELAWRNYIFTRTRQGYSAPNGLYVAPFAMYRRVFISGFDQVYNEEEQQYEMVEVRQKLNIFSGGFYAGWQFVLWDAITADVYVGGIIRLSKYDGEDKFTKYKQLQNIDYSGVMPGVGVKLGIVK
jgi:hypothetical protein